MDPAETQELESAFNSAAQAATAIEPGPNAPAQRRAVANELSSELASFAASHTNSAWGPSVRLWLARNAQIRSQYSQAMEHYRQAWVTVAGSNSKTAQEMGLRATGGLAKLLALTGRTGDLDLLEADARQSLTGGASGPEWGWAKEVRTWVRKHPTESYKCGLYCLDQLGRLTQPGQFRPKDITETPSSTNGFTAADLVRIGGQAGLRLHAALLDNLTNPPVPSILHLRSDHFVILRERRGAFYSVYDTVAFGPRWLLAEEIAAEESGCVLVSDAGPQQSQPLSTLDPATAAAYRGRCHGPLPSDHDDSPCYTCPCPPGTGGGGNGSGNGGTGGGGGGSGGFGSRIPTGVNDESHIGGGSGSHLGIPSGVSGGGGGSQGGAGGGGSIGGGAASRCPSCSGSGGMPSWFVSEPFLNLWVQDVPLAYTPAYGPAVELRLAYHDRVQGSLFTGNLWHGAQFGNDGGLHGLWSASWLSFAELDSAESKVDLMLPAGGWATFTFPANSAVSDVNYLHNLTLEKLGPSGGITNLTLHYTDGSSAIYDVADKSDTSYAGLFYVSKSLDPAGNKTSFAYDGNFFLTNVTAADGASFALQLDQTFLQPLVTNVTASYGASCSFSYGGTSYDPQVLVAIQDAGGISSLFDYEAPAGGLLTKLTTPYGTTFLSTLGDGGFYGIFDRTVRITNANDTQEFYGQINGYAGTDWPDFASGQIPTNTPLATLDTTERQERNTFYWNAQQFVPFVNTSLYDFDWAALKRSRIRHWLAKTEPNYTHFGSLSLQQEPSPDGTTEGQLTWYDYAGKPANVNYEPGTQIMPSVVARAMPDGGTAYQYFEYNSIGNATNMIEKWVEGIAAQFRTNHYVYAANGVDLLAWTNALGVRASSNVFNAHHQILTNYDALNQMTTYTYDNTTLQLTGAAHPSGLTTTYTYDANHRLQEASDSPISRTRDFTWYDSGDLKTLTDERGMVATNYWDGLHRLTGTSDSRGATTNLYERATAYPNSTGGTKILDVTATKDRLGNWTYFDYDPLRRLTAVTNANNVVTRYGYCDCGAVAYITNAWGTPVEEATVFGYDYQGNRIYTLNADGYNVTNSYDALRQLIATSDAVGGRSFFYNNLGLLTNVSNAYGAEQTTVYDLGDRAAYVSDANGVTITNTYDDLGRLRTRGYPDGGVEKFGYSARDLIAYTNQLGFTNAFGYDEAGRKIAETNANAEVLRYTYNAAGDLLTLVDGKSQTTTWHYDQFGRVTNKLNQAGVEILRYKYDADSRLTNRWSKAKGDTYYTYDAAGNLTLVDYPSSPDIAFRYDWLDRLTNMVDAAGTNKYTYTAGNRVLTDDGPFASDTVTNTYQNRLRTKLVLQQPTGSWTNALVYDAARRLTNVASPAGTSGYTLGATAPGSPLPRRLALPNTALITNTYDTVARLLGGYLKNSGGSVLDSYVYNYNAANQRTSLTRVDASTVDYRYDNLGQLTVADSSVNSEDRGYYYDAASSLNRLTNNGAVAAFTVDNQNQLTADPTCFQDDYDDNGNLRVRWVNIEGSVVRLFEYVYDDENRLITAIGYTNVEVGCAVWEDAPLWQTDLTYDGLGRLRLRTESGVTGPEPDSWAPLSTTEYIYDGMRVIQERDGGNTPQVSYTRGTDLSGSFEGAGGIGGLLARSEYNGSGGWTNHAYYFADANGNVTYMIDSSQTMVASYRYDPFGNTISKSGSLADANVYRFSSKEIHVNSGMYYYGYRFYDPNLQRWINRDPAFDLGWSILTREQPRESRVNLYRFVANTPLSAIDPLGLKIWVCTRGAFGGAVGRHSYIWDDRDLPNRYDPKKPWQRSCGQENISGSASSGSGTNTEGDNGPMPGFEGGVYHGPGDATCYPVQNSDGKEEGVRRCCENPREINAGMWFPFINDCHNRMNHCLEQGGIFPYEIPNHPRFGGGNYPPGYKY